MDRKFFHKNKLSLGKLCVQLATEKQTGNCRDISVGTHRDNEPSLSENSDHSNSGNNHYANVGEKGQKGIIDHYITENISTRIYKDICLFCFEDVGHFSRHLIRQHSDEEAVRIIMEMKNKSREKRMAMIALRKKGNFILNS
ncbi:hypothetical protein JTB14_008246 [Gonioctena quinquepunctata]|nr:hypothetical protein JTB14_008246 [Gonioctena quinquepunctata]